MNPYLVLLRVEFTLPRLLPNARCALTTPFHPYLILIFQAIGGLLSVALVVGSRLPGITWHSALWSPDFPPLPFFVFLINIKRSGDCLVNLLADYSHIKKNSILNMCYKK
ncbi:Conserved hypothetical protein [Candidatus Hamiltonella defensa (Bemisia tabaci)]|nr:Conserved hypothetical protein [Candidatus Hamiltonella defensa (Bemisia tabaci)]